MKFYILTLSLIALFAASCVTPFPTTRQSKTELLSRTASTDMSPEAIQKDLTRSCAVGAEGLGTGSIGIGVYPITMPLIVSQESVLGRKNLDSNAEIKRHILDKENSFLKKKTCFNIELHSFRGIESAQFKHWRAKLESSDGLRHELVFRNTNGVESVPKPQTYGAGVTNWINNSYACTDKELDFKPSFKVLISPQFGGDEVAACSVEWSDKEPVTKPMPKM